MRDADQLLESALKVIHWGYCHGANIMAPLFSGGNDSQVACHVASQHERFTRTVHHIDTGIGANYTRQHVEAVCKRFGWELKVHRSPETYEKFVRERGFPGPGAHQWVYNRIKERCVRMIARGRSKRLLITGCRSQESVRRMGHVDPVQVGEWKTVKCDACKTAKRTAGTCPYGACKRVKINLSRIWCAPCHDWSKADQELYMDEHGLVPNRLKTLIGISGECFCGAFAQEGEIDLIRQHCPEVAAEIDRLTLVAKKSKAPARWGHRPEKDRPVAVAETGPLCSSCDRRASAAGIITLGN